MSEVLVLEGNLIEKFDTETFGANNFQVRKFVIEVENEKNEEWNFPRLFQLTKDNCDMLDAYQLGDKMIVSYNLRGRKWENPKDGKIAYLNSEDAWRLEKVEGGNMPEFNAANMPPAVDDADPLPF